jgi:hypothetical protein
MSDDDELARLMRIADPAVTPIDAPLDERTLDGLHRLVGPATAGRELEIASSSRPIWIAVPSALALVLVIVLALRGWNLFGTTAPKAAAAATPPLLAATPSPYTFGEIMKLATQHLRAGGTPTDEPGRHASYATWNLNVDVDFTKTPSAYVSAEDVTSTWNPDLSGTLVRRVGQTIASDTPDASHGSLPPQVGTLLSSETFSPGERGVLNPATPPVTASEALEYLQRVAGEDSTDAVDLVDAVASVLNEWTLTPAQESAMLSALEGIDGFSTDGGVTDRLGRPGIALLARSETNTSFESLLVVSPMSGRILSVETIYLGGIQDLRELTVPSVVNYTAWRNE